MERALKLCKKGKNFGKEHEKQFNDILTKLKKGTLTKEERVSSQIPPNIEKEML